MESEVQAAGLGVLRKPDHLSHHDKVCSCDVRTALNVAYTARCDQNDPRKIGEATLIGCIEGKAMQRSTKNQVT